MSATLVPMALPSWVPDEETKPAPMPLLVVQSFVNTWEGDTGRDRLAEPVAASEWLSSAGLLLAPTGIGEAHLAELRQVRETLRALLVANGGGPAPGPADLAPLRAWAERSGLQPVVLDDGAVDLRPARGTAGAAVAPLLLIVRDAQRDGTWARLKACRNPECRWAYYDRSHAGRGAWCDMAVCGNRMKNRSLRSRRSAAEGRGR
jgi:predicted RNA-binding Zn ribbon-like protein